MWGLMSSDVGVDIIIRENKPYEGDFSKWLVVQIVFEGLALPLNPGPIQQGEGKASQYQSHRRQSNHHLL